MRAFKWSWVVFLAGCSLGNREGIDATCEGWTTEPRTSAAKGSSRRASRTRSNTEPVKTRRSAKHNGKRRTRTGATKAIRLIPFPPKMTSLRKGQS